MYTLLRPRERFVSGPEPYFYLDVQNRTYSCCAVFPTLSEKATSAWQERLGDFGKIDATHMAGFVVGCNWRSIPFVADIITDAVVDSVTDATKGAAFVTLEPGIHTHLKNLENLLKANHGGDGYFAGNKPTWADFITGMAWKAKKGFPLLKSIEKCSNKIRC